MVLLLPLWSHFDRSGTDRDWIEPWTSRAFTSSSSPVAVALAFLVGIWVLRHPGSERRASSVAIGAFAVRSGADRLRGLVPAQVEDAAMRVVAIALVLGFLLSALSAPLRLWPATSATAPRQQLAAGQRGPPRRLPAPRRHRRGARCLRKVLLLPAEPCSQAEADRSPRNGRAIPAELFDMMDHGCLRERRGARRADRRRCSAGCTC